MRRLLQRSADEEKLIGESFKDPVPNDPIPNDPMTQSLNDPILQRLNSRWI